ncbi:ATP-binding protein [Pseudomonas sp. CGJS7]|uniref:ATP-binding protein n=1 Tax=Pseudomonas sp. CGJS7 TaxID=3109348 RepID=UPI0030097C57
MTVPHRPIPTCLNLMDRLTLATIATALAINFFIALPAPTSSMLEVSLGTAIAVLRKEATVDNRNLKMGRDCIMLSHPASNALARVSVDILQAPHERFYTRWLHLSESVQIHPQVIVSGCAPRLNSDLATHRVFSSTDADRPAFEFAPRQSDGCWRAAEPAHAPTQAWRLRIVLAFALTVALLAPLAWWFVQRLTQAPLSLHIDVDRLGLERAFSYAASTKATQDEGRPTPEVQVEHEAACPSRPADDMASMLASVAHDLRIPLAALRLRVEMAPTEHSLRMAADLERMDAMIAQMLHYFRGRSQNESLVDTDLAQMVDECIDDAQALGKTVQASRIDAIRAVVEPLSLRRALINLIDNAVLYADGARVGLWREDNLIVLQVDDDGPGIPPDQSERLQKPFQRLESSRSRETGGLGLGLSVARQTALRHGGRLILQNRDMGGLSARLQWPTHDT